MSRPRLASEAMSIDLAVVGPKLHDLCRQLYPLSRSITGDGVRQTLAIIKELLPLTVHEVPSGTPVLDWTVPPEWNVREAYVANERGERVVDVRDHNLHLVGYSTPIRARMTLAELREHLFTLPDRPDWIPYRTSYYHETWGFCLAHRKLDELADGLYDVVIDSTLAPGSLTYGEAYFPGASDDEVLITAHVCHPSLCNDNLSGISLLTMLGAAIAEADRRLSYRLLLIPGTIGSIAWLAENRSTVERVRAGLVLSGVGDRGDCTYKRTRRGNAEIDAAVEHVLAASGDRHHVVDFSPYGYDERQFGSPGFNLPVGRFGRTPFGEYPEYHTSADDLEFITPDKLADSYAKVLSVVAVLEGNQRYRNLSPYGEPQLGRRGLYRSVGGDVDAQSFELALLWVLNLSDGSSTLLDIAVRSSLAFATVRRAADALIEAGLLDDITDVGA